MTDPRSETPSNGASDLVPRGTVPAVRCQAHRSNGDPCKRWAIVGGTVCPTHGGSAPQVRAAAIKRIQSRVLSAVDIAWKMIESEDVPAATRARLLIDMQDRAGLKPADVHVLAPGNVDEAPDLDSAMRQALAARGLMPEDQAFEHDDEDGELLDIEPIED